MKKLIIAIIVLGFATGATAQQLPQYTQYLINDYVMNPAVGGSRPYWDAKSNNRYQWEGITDAPRTYIFSLHGPLRNEKIGLGGYVFTDVTGPTRRTGFQASYSYHLRVTDDIKLGLGVSAGLLQFAIDASKIVFREDGDLALSSGVQQALVPDATAGLYLYSEKFWLSASAPQIIPYKLQFFEDYPQTDSKLVNHFFINGGYRFDLGDDFQLEPSFLAKYVNPVPLQFDATLRAIYQKQVWAGLSYRTEDAIALMLGYVFQENLMIGYSYDMATSNLRNYSNGTHEIMFGVKFRKRNNKPAASAGTAP